ncbi:hypothetical protein [Litorilituus lipolyticus]|uniref:Transporter substrate-binding domain-containing protein n=1 Tax=Litorilituus lipolyticus TaxID=2491017 RepID=A0A502KV78_9GAMM|nr:hypothetical protein [Litorilituus lipolyticus]TPH15548.1 hypothetical protein EPA86_08180 [Litorilituus lipolyticus]
MIFWNMAKPLGFNVKVKYAGQLDIATKAYIAFSPANKNSQRYRKILSEGIIKLRKSGELHQIISRYNIQDWK